MGEGIIKTAVAVGMFLTILLIMSSLTSFCYASTGSWIQKLGEDGYPYEFCALIQTRDGSYALAGRSTSGSIAAYSVFLLVKTDASGSMLWNKTYSIQPEDRDLYSDYYWSGSLIETSDGGFVIAGTMIGKALSQSQAGDTTYVVVNPDHFFVMKLDADGNVQWKKSHSIDMDGDSLWSIIQTSDGGFAVIGEAKYIMLSIGVGTSPYCFLAKLDSSGNMVWSVDMDYVRNSNFTIFFGASDNFNSAMEFSLIQTKEGGYAIARNDYTRLLLKVDSSGNFQWSKTYGVILTDRNWFGKTNSVIQTSDGGFAITGVDLSRAEGRGCWIAKTDDQLNLQWNQTYTGTSEPYSLVQTSDDGYALAGLTNASENGNSKQAFLLKTNNYGTKEWTQIYSNFYSMFFYLIQANDGGYAFHGYAFSLPSLVKTDSNGVVNELMPTPLATTSAGITSTPSGTTSSPENEVPNSLWQQIVLLPIVLLVVLLVVVVAVMLLRRRRKQSSRT